MHVKIDWKGGKNMYNQPLEERRGDLSTGNKMTVTGEGHLTISPQLALIDMEVITENTSLTKAQEDNAKLMNHVIKTLVQLGIPTKHIQTTAYTLQPIYEYQDGKQLLTGYEVRNALSVKLSQLSQVGKMIDTAVQAGVNRVTNIRFTVENIDIYYEQALKFALENGLRKAETMAAELQVPLHPTPLLVTEEVGHSMAQPRALATASETMTTPIQPGQLNVKAVVTMQMRY